MHAFRLSEVDPPTSPPVITTTSTPSSSDGSLYQGDAVTLTCTVSGGKPVSVTSVTFQCPSRNKTDQPDSTVSGGVSSSVTFPSLTDGDPSDVCTCSARWKTYTDWYTHTDDIQLYVNSKCFVAKSFDKSTLLKFYGMWRP